MAERLDAPESCGSPPPDGAVIIIELSGSSFKARKRYIKFAHACDPPTPTHILWLSMFHKQPPFGGGVCACVCVCIHTVLLQFSFCRVYAKTKHLGSKFPKGVI